MQDVRVRRAMNHAVNVDELIKQVLKGRATKMCGPLAPANVDYSPKVECYQVRSRARPGALQGGRASTRPSSSSRSTRRPAATRSTRTSRWPSRPSSSALGIKTNVVVNEWGTHLDKIKNRNTGDMFFLGWGPALDGQGTIQPLFLAEPDLLVLRQQRDDRRQDRPGGDHRGSQGAARGLGRAAEARATTRRRGCSSGSSTTSTAWPTGSSGRPRADEKVWMYEAKIVAR